MFRQARKEIALPFSSATPLGKRKAMKQARFFFKELLALLHLSPKTNLIEKL